MQTGAPLSGYALLSDCQTAALVGRDGSVDWWCPPRFDSPSVFARLLDEGGGHWSITPTDAYEAERTYVGETMVLRTEFRTEEGRVALVDALAFEDGARGGEVGLRSPHALLRRVEGIEGEVGLRMEFVPRLEYGLTAPLLFGTEAGAVARGGPAELQLIAGCPLELGDTRAEAGFVVRAGESVPFGLVYRRVAGSGDGEPPELEVGTALENARLAWESWVAERDGYRGPYGREVRRSTLVLQALNYAPTGAVVAAPTMSLPEVPGGDRNWDYRYAWLRDLSLTMRALYHAACPEEATRFFYWVDRAGGSCLSGGQLQTMYGVEGERDLTEHALSHLSGYRNSRPVRVGNDAWFQRQIDVYGEVVDSAYLLRDRLGEEFDETTARLITALADRAAGQWREPDSGMWEARDRERHYLSSKVMCWVALDRAIRLAPRLGERAEVARWKEARGAVREAILTEGWNEEVGAFTGAFGSDRLDASVLLMPLVGFLPADDERMMATVERIEEQLVDAAGLVHRWKGDANGFLICTYWFVECMVGCGRIEEAKGLFEKVTERCSNDLGLLAEQYDPAAGELRGNFPQAFSHVGLINAAHALAEARASRP